MDTRMDICRWMDMRMDTLRMDICKVRQSKERCSVSFLFST